MNANALPTPPKTPNRLQHNARRMTMDMMTRFEYAEDVHADGEFVPFSDRNAERRAFAAIAGTDEIQEAALEGGQGVTLIEAWRAAGRPARFTLRQPGRPAEMEVADLSEEDARALFE